MTTLSKPVTRKTDSRLPAQFLHDRDKRLVITLHPGGMIELRPERTRRSERIAVLDVYRYALRCRVNLAVLERARNRKAARAARLAAARVKRAEKRMFGTNNA